MGGKLIYRSKLLKNFQLGQIHSDLHHDNHIQTVNDRDKILIAANEKNET